LKKPNFLSIIFQFVDKFVEKQDIYALFSILLLTFAA